MENKRKVAVVTGANRGMGFEACRQLGELGYRVVLTSRDEMAGHAAAEQLLNNGLDIVYHKLDVTDAQQISTFVDWLRSEGGMIDVLINNAGIFPEGKDYPEVTSALEVEMAVVRHTLETNTLGHLALCQEIIPMMKKRGYGRVVFLSSVAGRLSDMGSSMPGLRLSHVANNALARIFAAETEDDNIKVNAICPFWVKTRMGGPSAPRNVEDGVETTIWLATLPDDGPSGGFFRDKQQLEW
jgi:NAD(P)-dependent dehydrogenase (short-subunit alcohol dehydrogenase family)